jgi:UDPglucose 6-dehydrogenase
MMIGIVGFGVVGGAIARLLSKGGHEVAVFDKFVPPFDRPYCKARINHCDLAFICVPTNEGPVTGECDLSQVDECVSWISVPMCVKSTVVPGTVDRLSNKYGKALAFSPEYIGEHRNHPWKEIDQPGFVIVGGSSAVQDLVISALESGMPVETKFYRTGAKTAELCKYMENCFLASKVAFVNQFYDIARALGIDFEEVRRLWLLDSRVGDSHTHVTAERGFGGRCLPKDLHAIIAAMRTQGKTLPLLESISQYNDSLRPSLPRLVTVAPARQITIGSTKKHFPRVIVPET